MSTLGPGLRSSSRPSMKASWRQRGEPSAPRLIAFGDSGTSRAEASPQFLVAAELGFADFKEAVLPLAPFVGGHEVPRCLAVLQKALNTARQHLGIARLHEYSGIAQKISESSQVAGNDCPLCTKRHVENAALFGLRVRQNDYGRQSEVGPYSSRGDEAGEYHVIRHLALGD